MTDPFSSPPSSTTDRAAARAQLLVEVVESRTVRFAFRIGLLSGFLIGVGITIALVVASYYT